MAVLRIEDVETDGAGFRALGPHAMPDGLLSIFRHEAFQFGFGLLVFEMRRSSPRKDPSELRPGVRRAHVDDAHRFDARPRRLGAEQDRGLAILDAAPEFPLSSENEVLIERIGMGLDLDPLAASGDDREYGTPRRNDPHVML